MIQCGGNKDVVDNTNEVTPNKSQEVSSSIEIDTTIYDYEFVPHISASAAYKVIGNAVPPLLAFFIGNHLEKIWKELFDV